MPLELRTVGGQTIELPNLDDTALVRDIAMTLVEDLSYNPGVSLMFAGRILKPDQGIGGFPHGGIMVVGKVVPRAAKPAAPAASAAAPAAKAPPTDMTIYITVPAAQREVSVTVSSDATVGDLAKAAQIRFPQLNGAKYVHAGNVLSNEGGLLKAFGVFDGAKLHAAVGASADPKLIQIMQVREGHAAVVKRIAGRALSDNERKHTHEECMRLLFKLDEIKEVSEEVRAERKTVAKLIQVTQDSLGGDNN